MSLPSRRRARGSARLPSFRRERSKCASPSCACRGCASTAWGGAGALRCVGFRFGIKPETRPLWPPRIGTTTPFNQQCSAMVHATQSLFRRHRAQQAAGLEAARMPPLRSPPLRSVSLRHRCAAHASFGGCGCGGCFGRMIDGFGLGLPSSSYAWLSIFAAVPAPTWRGGRACARKRCRTETR